MNVMKFFQGISRFLAAYTSPVIVGVAAITFVYPELFRWVKGDIQTLVLGIIMLTMGMTLTTEDFKILAKRPLDIFIGAAAQYTLMPLIAFVLVKVMNLPPGIAAGLLLVGLGCAPVYPCIIHSTPANFGPEKSQALIGVQMASASLGICLMPPLFGLIAEHITVALMPWYLLLILILMTLMHERLLKKVEY